MKRKILAGLFVVLAFAGVAGAEIQAGPGIAVAQTETGKLQGYIRNGIYTYHGVSYAQTERFMPRPKSRHGKA